MKYILITLEYPPFKGGVAHYYGHLAQYFPGQMEVMTNDGDSLVNGRWPVFGWLPGLFAVLRRVKADKIDYLLVGNILPLGTIAWLINIFWRRPYAVFLHGTDLAMAQATPRKLWLAKKILTGADHIIGANSRVASDAKELLASSQWGKVAVVNPGIEPKIPIFDKTAVDSLRKQYNLAHQTVFLSVGRLVRRKGFDLVIEALAACQRPDFAYVIAGQGPEEDKLRQVIDEYSLNSQVRLIGAVSDEDKQHWLQLADVFVTTSREENGDYEGFGIVYLEAGLAGKPVIAGRSGGVADAVVDNETGIMVTSGDIKELSEAMVKLADFSSLRLRLGDAGRQRALRDFNWQNQAQKVFDFLCKR
ncbi:MAG: glycosyltransferase family 4 protein [Candidatus Falkowbacteria bacterium]